MLTKQVQPATVLEACALFNSWTSFAPRWLEEARPGACQKIIDVCIRLASQYCSAIEVQRLPQSDAADVVESLKGVVPLLSEDSSLQQKIVDLSFSFASQKASVYLKQKIAVAKKGLSPTLVKALVSNLAAVDEPEQEVKDDLQNLMLQIAWYMVKTDDMIQSEKARYDFDGMAGFFPSVAVDADQVNLSNVFIALGAVCVFMNKVPLPEVVQGEVLSPIIMACVQAVDKVKNLLSTPPVDLIDPSVVELLEHVAQKLWANLLVVCLQMLQM